MTAQQELNALREAGLIVETLIPYVTNQHGSALLSNIPYNRGRSRELWAIV